MIPPSSSSIGRIARNLRRAAIAVVIAACGSSCGGTSPQVQVAEMYVSVAAEDGYEVDPACVSEEMEAMSEADARALVDAGLDGNADLSEAGIDVLTGVANRCIDVVEYLDRLVADYSDDPTVDPECIRASLADQPSVDAIDRATEVAVQRCRVG